MRKRVRVRLFLLIVIFGLLRPAVSDERWRHVAGPAYRAFDLSLDLQERYLSYVEMLRILYEQNGGMRIVHVDPRAGGRSDGSGWQDAFHSIREAVEALGEEGGWIWVAEGEYRESVDLPSRVCLFGGFCGLEDDLDDRDIERYRTVLEGDGTRSVVTMAHYTILDGFTVRNGGGEAGAGVLTGGWLSVIRNNVIRDNVSSWSGGGILVSGGFGSDGAYGSVDGMGPVIERNLIVHNSGNCGSGITTRYSLAMILNNTVANNGGGDRARGLEILMRTAAEPTVLNNIFWNNGDDLYFQVGNTGDGVFRNNCVQDETDWHVGIVYGDPQFADSGAGDYRLSDKSPCIEAGVPGAFLDPDGSRGDIGAFFYSDYSASGGTTVRFESGPVQDVLIQIDGSARRTPQNVYWPAGSAHWVRPAAYHPVDRGASYAFTGWDDGGDRVRRILADPSATRYTARYGLRYLLEVTGEPFPDCVTGEGWHFADATITVSADTVVADGADKRMVFSGWTGIGAGSYTGAQPSFQTMLGGPVTQTVRYESQFLLTARVSPDTVPGLVIRTDPAGPWFNAGRIVKLTAESDNPLYRFSGWDSGTPDADGSLTLIMDGPAAVTALFEMIVRHPPAVADLADTTMPEDGALVLADAWIAERVRDGGDLFSALNVSLTAASPLQVLRDAAAGGFRVVPPADWSGSGSVRLRVTDPSGDSDEKTFILSVIPVPDPPGPFSLVSPEDGAQAGDSGAVMRFAWAESANVDPGDVVRYRFTLDADSLRLGPGAAVDTILDNTSADLPVPNGLLVFWTVQAFDGDGLITPAGPARRLVRTSGVFGTGDGSGGPVRFSVSPGFPNPFNPETAFEITLPSDATVRVSVFDSRGARIRTRPAEVLRAGVHRVAWDGRDDAGEGVASGVYTVRVEADGRTVLRKATLIR
ncbi:MAG: FlgD immunoglobulin-like domain containing protein [bacterium]|nr:FlgD immunoglobulin-like domain containing protein [bacterium]